MVEGNVVCTNVGHTVRVGRTHRQVEFKDKVLQLNTDEIKRMPKPQRRKTRSGRSAALAKMG